MTTFGINCTESEPVHGWEDNQPKHHTQNMLFIYSEKAWKLASKMVDQGKDWKEIENMQNTARELENLARNGKECHCVLPEQHCEVCELIARIIYEEEFNE